MAINILRDNFNCRPKEKVLMIFDENVSEDLFNHFFKEAEEQEAILICIFQDLELGQEPPPLISKEMKNNDIVLILTTQSLTHSEARRTASAFGTRIASMPGFQSEMLESGGLFIDYEELYHLNNSLIRLLNEIDTIRITCPLGTDIEFKPNQPWFSDHGDLTKRGKTTNLPSGEIFTVPLSGNGTVVFSKFCEEIKSPITFEVRDSKIIDTDSIELNRILSKFKNSRNLAEFGIGTNNQAIPNRPILEAEKVLGTAHFALGNNISFRGKSNSPIHLDGIIFEPNFFLKTQNNKLITLSFPNQTKPNQTKPNQTKPNREVKKNGSK